MAGGVQRSIGKVSELMLLRERLMHHHHQQQPYKQRELKTSISAASPRHERMDLNNNVTISLIKKM